VGVFERETQPVKVLIDTNIIVDVALDRDPFFTQSEQIVRLAELKQIEGYISASTFSDLYYVIRKIKGKGWTFQFLQKMATVCQIATVDQAVVSMALTTNFRDFEDAIQYSTAVLNHLDVIVTRNSQDFAGAALTIMAPDTLIQELTNYSWASTMYFLKAVGVEAELTAQVVYFEWHPIQHLNLLDRTHAP